MRHIYGLRLASLGLAALCIIIGAIMTFYGLEGSFDWAIEAPSTAGAKLTNASPGIVFATVGMLIGLLTVSQKPVGFSTGGEGISLGAAELSETAQKERRAWAETRSLDDRVRRAENQVRHSAALKDNHGFAIRYLRTILTPVGLNVPDGIETPSLQKLADARGSFAHTMAKKAMYGEYKKAKKSLAPEEARKLSEDCLVICEKIKNQALARW